MSLTRIDFSSSSHSPSPVQGQSIMDENHNHKTTHRLTRQNTSVIDPANRSPFILPAVSPTNLRSVLPTKVYKGVDVGPTKLPPSSNVVTTTINSILGEVPLKRTNAGGGICGGNDNFMSRQSADDFHLESPVSYLSPSVSKSISFPYLHSMSSSQCLIKNDDTLLEKIPQITRRTSSKPDEESNYNVTSALAAANCKSNDSKVQDQSQAQGKCCGGHSSTCDSQQTHLIPSFQSFQANQEEMFQVEGAALSQKQFFERLEQHGSSQEIIFLKKGKGYQNWNPEGNTPLEAIQDNHTENQYEFHQIFMGHMHYSNSAQSISSNPQEMPKIDDTEAENGIRQNESPAEEESTPATPSLNFIYEDDFELESQPESCHDVPNSFEILVKEETVERSVSLKEQIAEENADDISPMVDIIKNVTNKLPPLRSRGKDPLRRKGLSERFRTELASEDKSLRELCETKLATYLNLQGSGSEGDDEESDSGDCSAVKWTSNWTMVENEPNFTCHLQQGVSMAKDSIEHMKNIKENENNEKVVASGRKLWNKDLGKDTDFREFLINETSVSCAKKLNMKSPRTPHRPLTSIRTNIKIPESTVLECRNEPKDVIIWEGSQCQHSNNASHGDNATERNPPQQSAPQRNRRSSTHSHMSKIAPNSRRNSRDGSSKKQNEILQQFNKEQQAISDLVSAVYRLKRLQKNKILEDYVSERPMTQGSWGYNPLGTPLVQMQNSSQRPRSSPSSFAPQRVSGKESGSGGTKPKVNHERKGLVEDSIKLLENSILSTIRVEDKLKKVNNTRRPMTPIPIPNKPNRPKTMTDSAMKRLEKIARVYNVKSPFTAIIATQTPRKGERLLTPTKDRKSTNSKVTMATQTTTKSTPPKSALKKTVENDRGIGKNISTKNEDHSFKKKVVEYKILNSETAASSVENKPDEAIGIPEDIRVTSKHSRKKLSSHKKTACDANLNNQLYQIAKKGSFQNKLGLPELTVFHSEQPSKSHFILKSDLHYSDKEMVSEDPFNSSSEFSHYEGCGKRSKQFSHELNVIADEDVDICYRIVPPSYITENKSSHDKCEERRSDTVIRLSARRIKSQDSSKTLRKKSSHKDLSSSRSNHTFEQKIKSFSNIELMTPHNTSSAVDQDFIRQSSSKTLRKKSSHKDLSSTRSNPTFEQKIKSYSNIELIVPHETPSTMDQAFVDLDIVVRRKSELGFYPSLGTTKSRTDDKKMLLLLDEDGDNPVAEKKWSKLLEPSPTPSTSTKYKDATSWKQRFGIDFHGLSTDDAPKNISNINEQQPLKFYGQEYTPVQFKKYESKNSNKVDITNSVDKVPKILYKRRSRDVCQSISSDALIMFEHKQAKPSIHDVERKIKEVYEKSGLTVSEHQALQLITSQNMLNDFLNDYVPENDVELDAIVKGIATTLRFFGLLPDNNLWAGFLTNESEI